MAEPTTEQSPAPSPQQQLIIAHAERDEALMQNQALRQRAVVLNVEVRNRDALIETLKEQVQLLKDQPEQAT